FASPARRLIIAVMLFIFLDLSILVTNFQIAWQVEMDAVAINLAGRQRMLSQRITKAALLADLQEDEAKRAAARQELLDAFAVFSATLQAFDRGGRATGGDGQTVQLRRVDNARARAAIESAIDIMAPWQHRAQQAGGLLAQASAFRDFMEQNNLQILTWMNQLTTALESDSVERVGVLRQIQTVAFVLALLNFLAIVRAMYLQHRRAADESWHWQQAAQRDALTGALNKAAFNHRFRKALREMEATQGALVVLVIDLDDFKQINDTSGHAVGDAVLIQFVAALKALARDSDVLGRIGGDEFCLLCPGMHSGQGMVDFCDRLVAAVAAIRIAGHPEVTVKASIGTAIFPRDGKNSEVLFDAADAAMYAAKRQGGGRYIDASEWTGFDFLGAGERKNPV
ncbi:MAG: diguanylate cyclase, partial [Dechloromonas sp.]|nr:diguanylate cyclase [Dechloromonas sp.]